MSIGPVTVFAHAIAQGASWDLDLVTRISNATSIEGRILTEMDYISGRGMNAGSALSCDGGPLANSAHDPRWGRISETYGEDPFHIQAIGVAILQALQNRVPVPGGKPTDFYYATRQVTRHFIGYHSASDDIKTPAFTATNRSLADSYFPTYSAFMRPDAGAADGIMCAMTTMNGDASCASHWLLNDTLRVAWKSDALIQTDCCDSLSSMVNAHDVYDPKTKKNVSTYQEALSMSVDNGLQVYFGFDGGAIRPDFMYNLGNGTTTLQQLEDAAARILLSQMRLGLFAGAEYAAGTFPWIVGNVSTVPGATIPMSMLDSDAHRTLARESAAKSTVLLKNAGGTLPFTALKGQNVAVIGPFAHCGANATEAKTPLKCSGRGCNNCYLHSYNGIPSKITSVWDAIKGAVGPSATYALGANFTCLNKDQHRGAPGFCTASGTPGGDAIASAVAAAKAAEVVVIVLGLSSRVEAEGNDRRNMTLPQPQTALLAAVLAAKLQTQKIIAIVVSAGGVDLGDAARAKLDAIVWAPYGGEEAGTGLLDVLDGTVVPSAKLPLTVYKQSWADTMNW